MPYTDKVDPKRKKVLSDSAEPMDEKSRIAKVEPSLASPKTESDAPSLQKDRSDKADPMLAKSTTAKVLPSRAQP
jgi:hypothetical protein